MNAFRKLKRAAAVVIGASALCAAIPAIAGQYPARQLGSNETTDHPIATKGVSDNVIGSTGF